MSLFRVSFVLLLGLLATSQFADDYILCVADDGVFHYAKNCVEQKGLEKPVTPSQRERKFLWISHSQRGGVIGVIPPGATVAKAAAVGKFALHTSIAGPPDVDGLVVLTDEKLGTWTITLEPWWFRDGRLNISVPKGTWDLSITAGGKPLQRPVRVAFLGEPGKNTLANRPLPPPVRAGRIVLSGRAMSRDRTPADFAKITADCNRVVCEADENGKFHCEIDVPPGGAVCLEHPQFGRKRIELDARISHLDLGPVQLIAGSVIRVIKPLHVELPTASTLTLRRKGKEIGEPQPIDGRELVEFAGLDSGPYEVLLAGPQALQRKLFRIELGEAEEKEVVLSLDAYRLTGDVELRDKPLPGARIELSGEAWRADLEADQSGRFNAELWSPGDYAVLIEASALPQPYLEMKRASASDSHWRFVVPSRRISGRVSDAETGAPIGDASLFVDSTSGETHWSRAVVAEEDGTFDISGVGEGTYTLSARAPAYLAGDKITLTVSKRDGDRELDLPLERGITIPITVVDTNGEPVRDATVAADFTPDGSKIKRLFFTDANGRVLVPMTEKSSKTVFIIPRSGSLAIARITSEDPNGAKLIVPDPVVTLTLRTRNSSDEGVPLVQYGIRYQGQNLPRALLQSLARARSFALITGTSGDVSIPLMPAGRYDIDWFPPAKATPSSARTSVEAAGGETVAAARFR